MDIFGGVAQPAKVQAKQQVRSLGHKFSYV